MSFFLQLKPILLNNIYFQIILIAKLIKITTMSLWPSIYVPSEPAMQENSKFATQPRNPLAYEVKNVFESIPPPISLSVIQASKKSCGSICILNRKKMYIPKP